jgi:hypothetical protein
VTQVSGQGTGLRHAPIMASASSVALEALHAKLADDAAREAYWAALTRFLRLESSKEEFDKQAIASLGPHVSLHNNLIFSLLKDAQRPASQPPVPLDSNPFAAHHIFQGGSSNGAAQAQGGGGGPSEPALSAQASSSSAPKLMLKIRSDGTASSQRPTLVVDPQEEAQVRRAAAPLPCPCCPTPLSLLPRPGHRVLTRAATRPVAAQCTARAAA